MGRAQPKRAAPEEGASAPRPRPRRARELLRFGTAGTPHTAKPRDHLGAVRRLRELGLGCYEMQFTYGVRIRPETIEEVRRLSQGFDIHLTCHGPYYINLLSAEPEKRGASRQRVLESARALHACGGDGVAFHAAFYQKLSREEAYRQLKEEMARLSATLKEEGCQARLNPETTGKDSQFGSLEELLRLAKEMKDPGVGLCVDFSHLHARTAGANNTYAEFASQLERIQRALGKGALKGMHIHLAGIEYGPRGEKNHLNLQESDMDYQELFKALADFGVEGVVVCESPNLEADALLMRKTYRAL
ncbi:MAG: TIM barrel protein [Nitrospinota bacterium]